MKKLLLCWTIIIIGAQTLLAQKPINWTSFKWGHDTIVVNGQKAYVPKSAIFLPVTLDSDARRYYLQLDMGTDANILLYSLPVSIGNNSVNRKPVTSNELVNCYKVDANLKGKLGGMDMNVDSNSYLLMRSKTDLSPDFNIKEGSIIGTVGLKYFHDKVLIIDFPRQQFAIISDPSTLPDPFRDTASFIHTNMAGYRLAVPVTIHDSLYKGFFYDAGSSIFDLLVSKKTWQKLTGKKGDETDNTKLSVNQWGSKLEAIGAPMKYPVTIGKATIALAMVFYLPAYPDLKTAYGCDGLFSNSAFYSKSILIDLKRNRLGIINEM